MSVTESLQAQQFREYVIRPTLHEIGLWSEAAENLLLGTALVESGLLFVRQIRGPALSYYQIEPRTHAWLVDEWLQEPAHHDLKMRILALRAPVPDNVEQLITNLAYSTAVCRLRYWVRPEPLPQPDDLRGLAQYWKDWFNTAKGKGDPAKFVKMYRAHMPMGGL